MCAPPEVGVPHRVVTGANDGRAVQPIHPGLGSDAGVERLISRNSTAVTIVIAIREAYPPARGRRALRPRGITGGVDRVAIVGVGHAGFAPITAGLSYKELMF